MNSLALIRQFFPAGVRPLLDDPGISDLMFQEGKVFVDRGGVLSGYAIPVPDGELMAAIETIARMLGKDISAQNPILDTRLPDGSRVAAMYPPCSPLGPTLTIRKFTCWYTLEELIRKGSLSVEVSRIIVKTLLNRQNVLISGGTSSGKTTFAEAFLEALPSDDRLIVIEKPIELSLRSQSNAVRWEAVDELPGQAEVTVAQLLKAALRHRPDRIIVGEVRDEAAYDLLQAWNTGHGGSLSTIHASGAERALDRLSDLALAAHSNLDAGFIRGEIASAIQLVVHVERSRDGQRRVKEVVSVKGYASGFFTLEWMGL